MPIVTLEQARMHLRVDDDDEDDLIELFIATAGEQVQGYLGRLVFSGQAELDEAVATGAGGDRPMVSNASTKAAALLLIGHLYEGREDGPAGLSSVSRAILDPFRIGQGV